MYYIVGGQFFHDLLIDSAKFFCEEHFVATSPGNRASFRLEVLTPDDVLVLEG